MRSDGADLHKRLRDVPGFGPMKAETLVAILGKQLGVAPAGWEAFVPDHMTLGDVDGPGGPPPLPGLEARDEGGEASGRRGLSRRRRASGTCR